MYLHRRHTRDSTLGVQTLFLIVEPYAVPAKIRMFASRRFALAWLVAWSLLLNSIPAHKEFRFLLPALQLLMPYAGAAVAQLVHALCVSMQDCDTKQTAARARAADEARLSEGHASGGAVADTVHTSEPGAASADGGDYDPAGKVVRSTLLQRPVAGRNSLNGPASRPAARSPEEPAAAGEEVPDTVGLRRQQDRRKRRGRRRRMMLAAAAVVLCSGAQLAAAAYFCFVHQRCGTRGSFAGCCPAHWLHVPTAELPCTVIPASLHLLPFLALPFYRTAASQSAKSAWLLQRDAGRHQVSGSGDKGGAPGGRSPVAAVPHAVPRHAAVLASPRAGGGPVLGLLSAGLGRRCRAAQCRRSRLAATPGQPWVGCGAVCAQAAECK